MEIVEEENLLHRMIQEKENAKDSGTWHLMKDTGDSPQTIIGHGASGAAGAGGSPEYAYFNPNITPNFTSSVQSGHIPFTVLFTNLTTGDIKYINYNWTFGDGSGSTDTNPSHKYTKTGSFTVALTGSALSNPSIASYLAMFNYISSST
jgi:PKD repeat protein